MARFGNLGTQYFDGSGDPLINGLINFYEPGTTTRKDTFSDIAQTVKNANPVVLYADGRQPDVFFSGTAKAVLTTSAGVQIAVLDPVGETSTNFGSAWLAGRIYNGNEVVVGADGKFYKSSVNGNQNNDPTVSPTEWALLYSIEWAAAETYAIGANVTDEDGLLYQSLQDSNTNNPPSSSPTFWIHVMGAWLPNYTYAEGQNAVASDGILYTSLQNGNLGNDPVSEPTFWAGTSAAAAASAAAASVSEANAAASEAAAELAEAGAQTAETGAVAARVGAELAEDNSLIYAAAAQAAAGIPSLAGNALRVLTVNEAENGVAWGERVAISYDEITASGTWTKPAGATLFMIQMVNGGNSGHAAVGGPQQAGAPGGYGQTTFVKADDLPASVSCIIGAGGAAATVSGTSGSQQGSAGGTTSFDGYANPAQTYGAAGGAGALSGVLAMARNVLTTGEAAGDYSGDTENYGYSSASTGGKNSANGGPGGGSTQTTTGGTSLSLNSTGGAGVTGDNVNATATAGSGYGAGGGSARVINPSAARIATSGAGGNGVIRIWGIA